MDPLTYLEQLHECGDRDGLEASELEPAQVMDIMTAERTLGTSLPEDYQEFLVAVGCGPVYGGLSEWFHLDITIPGNIVDVSRELAAAEVQRSRDKHQRNLLPHGFLTIYDSCDGDIFGFVPADSSTYQAPVFAWDRDTVSLREVAPSFSAFLEWIVDCDQVESGSVNAVAIPASLTH
jgi:hypothetical protein